MAIPEVLLDDIRGDKDSDNKEYDDYKIIIKLRSVHFKYVSQSASICQSNIQDIKEICHIYLPK